MAHFPSMCYSTSINTQVLFYDEHDIKFEDLALAILWIHRIHYFLLREGVYANDHQNNNSPNVNLNNVYGNGRMQLTNKHRTLKFMPAHMNCVLVEICEDLKLLSSKITQGDFNKTHLVLHSLTDKGTNQQDLLAATQTTNSWKDDEK